MVYLDNAATSYPKPPRVIEAVCRFFVEKGANPGRGSHKMALAAAREIFEAREALASFFGVSDSGNIALTNNCTEALNLALKGLLKPGDHVITTSMEHNSVARPLKKLEGRGIATTKVAAGLDGSMNPADIERAIRPETALIVVTGASNVIGSFPPLEELSALAEKHALYFMVDGAQIVGHRPVDVVELGIHLLAFPGHKGLMGPQGTGGLYIHPDIDLDELLEGGTGTNSRSETQPLDRPDRYESGTPNGPGIAGLRAALSFFDEVGLDEIAAKEEALTQRLVEGLLAIPGVTVYGPGAGVKRTPVVSFNIEGIDADRVSAMLDQEFDIASRPGLHCSPDAHITLGTLEMGAVRLSPGFFNEPSDIDKALQAVNAIAKERVLVS